MKIIKQSYKYQAECSCCNTLFAFNENNIKYDSCSSNYVVCPNCRTRIYVHNGLKYYEPLSEEEEQTKNKPTMTINFKKLSEKAVTPTKAHATDAGFDLTAVSRAYDPDGNIVYGTGIAVEIPEGYVGLIFPRSSISKQQITLTNSVGVIDSGYRGEIIAKFKPTLRYCDHDYRHLSEPDDGCREVCSSFDGRTQNYSIGDRIAQLIIIPYPQIKFNEAQELTPTIRGCGGYGSTGR